MRIESKRGLFALLFVAVFAFSWSFVASALAGDGPGCDQSPGHPQCGTCSYCLDGNNKKWCDGGTTPPCVPHVCVQFECFEPHPEP